MRLIGKTQGKAVVRISKAEWLRIGKEAGWVLKPVPVPSTKVPKIRTRKVPLPRMPQPPRPEKPPAPEGFEWKWKK